MLIRPDSFRLLGSGFLICLSIIACYAQGSDVIAKDVYQALNEASRVNVIVMLVLPSSMSGGNPVSDEVKEDIDNLQQEVLATLSPADFKLSIKYENIPSLAGSLTRAGVKKLASNPLVARVDRDVGGSGSKPN